MGKKGNANSRSFVLSQTSSQIRRVGQQGGNQLVQEPSAIQSIRQTKSKRVLGCCTAQDRATNGASAKTPTLSIPEYKSLEVPRQQSSPGLVKKRSSVRSLRRALTQPVRRFSSSTTDKSQEIDSKQSSKSLGRAATSTGGLEHTASIANRESLKKSTSIATEPQTPLGHGADVVFGAVADLGSILWSTITGSALPIALPADESTSSDGELIEEKLMLRITAPPTTSALPTEKYMQDLLQEERRAEFTAEDKVQEKKLKEFLGKQVKDYDDVGPTHQLNIVRGFEDHKSKRAAVQAESITGIVKWRRENDIDNLFRTRLPDQDKYYKFWPTSYCGLDDFGHQIIMERVVDIDVDGLFKMGQENVLRLRTQLAEAIFIRNKLLSIRGQHRISRHIYILDVKGLSLTKHFDSKTRNFLPPLFALTGDMYPNGLWSLHIVNVPLTFRVVWNVIQHWIDKKVKEKIHMHSSNKVFMSYCDTHNISRDNIPTIVGGNLRNALPFTKIVDQMIDEEYPNGLPP